MLWNYLTPGPSYPYSTLSRAPSSHCPVGKGNTIPSWPQLAILMQSLGAAAAISELLDASLAHRMDLETGTDSPTSSLSMNRAAGCPASSTWDTVKQGSATYSLWAEFGPQSPLYLAYGTMGVC